MEKGLIFLMDTVGPAAFVALIVVGLPLGIVTTTFGWPVLWCVLPTVAVFIAFSAWVVGGTLQATIADASRRAYDNGRSSVQQERRADSIRLVERKLAGAELYRTRIDLFVIRTRGLAGHEQIPNDPWELPDDDVKRIAKLVDSSDAWLHYDSEDYEATGRIDALNDVLEVLRDKEE
jgi:hypothetical protein